MRIKYVEGCTDNVLYIDDVENPSMERIKEAITHLVETSEDLPLLENILALIMSQDDRIDPEVTDAPCPTCGSYTWTYEYES